MAFIICGLFLQGCDSPSLAYRDSPAIHVQSKGMEFTIRKLPDGHAQAIRTSFKAFANYEEVFATVKTATQKATGCDVIWGQGDVSVINMGLSCDGIAAPPEPGKSGKKKILILLMS